VIPRRRVRFDPGVQVEFSLFGSNDPVFKCLGGYFTHNSYNLFDWFVSYWHDLAVKKWVELFREDYPMAFRKNHLDSLMRFTPILRYKKEDLFEIRDNLPELFHHFQDYARFEASDLDMRSHPSLQRLSSRGLYDVIERTSKSKIKTIYPIRILDAGRKGKPFTWFYEMNLKETDSWWQLFSYRVVEEIKGKDGRINERIYRFQFADLLPILMIHNTLCRASWTMNPNLYKLSPDAQLFYRYLVIAGARLKYHRVDFIGHRLGWREKQAKRIASALNPLLKEIEDAGLLSKFTSSNLDHRYFFSFEVKSPKNKKDKVENESIRIH
jgi:hypothetical protein